MLYNIFIQELFSCLFFITLLHYFMKFLFIKSHLLRKNVRINTNIIKLLRRLFMNKFFK